jgi:hypothetical protein
MKAFIPEIDSKVRLTKDWAFELHFEHRNYDIYTADGHKHLDWRDERKPYNRTLPKGSVFSISRIYVRNGAKDFSSVTLYILETTDEKLLAVKPNTVPFKAKGQKHYGRFWVKLSDFNNAEFEVVEDATQVGEPTLVKGEVLSLRQFKSFGKHPRKP